MPPVQRLFIFHQNHSSLRRGLDWPFIRVPALAIDIYPGQYLLYDEEDNDYYADFVIYVFMKLVTKEIVYDEGYTSFGTDVHNYCHMNFQEVNFKHS